MPRKKKKVSIYSLAKDLEVSPATVSKAMNNYAEISSDLREKIRAYAEEMNFNLSRPSRKAVNLCALIRHYVGHPIRFSPYIASVMEGISEYANEHGLEFSIFCGEADKLNSLNLIRELMNRKVDGAIMLQMDDDCHFLESLQRQKFPFVCLRSDDGKGHYPLITVDDVAISKTAVKYLIQLGHREIGAIVTPPRHPVSRARIKGILEAFEDEGIEPRKHLLFENEAFKLDLLKIGYETTLHALNKFPELTALLVMNHHVGVGALHALRQLKLRIPEDFSLLSSDDFPQTAFFNPPLTVMHLPNQELGYIAAQRVHGIVDPSFEISTPFHQILKADFIIRESTGPVRSAPLNLP